MTTDELIDNINALTRHTKIMSGVDGNTGHEIDGSKGYYAFTDEDGNVICEYSSNGYAYDDIFKIDIAEKEFIFTGVEVRNNRYFSAPKDETAKIFKILSLYLDQDQWWPTKEFRKKEIEEIKQEMKDKQEDLQGLQNRLDTLEKSED